MPTYEYKCVDCGQVSTLWLSMRDRERGPVSCPNCSGKRMEQLIATVTAKTSRKS